MTTTAEKIAECKRRIEVMEAAERGEPIRHMAIQNSVTGWCDTKEFRWDWEKFVYEVKPEPREWWIVENRGGGYITLDVRPTPWTKATHVREVIEP